MSQPNATLIVPKPKDQPLHPNALNVPYGTPYVLAEYTNGDFASAVNRAVETATTDLCVLSASDAWLDHNTLDFGEMLWDADMAYGYIIDWENDVPVRQRGGDWFDANRLLLENYLPELAFVKRDSFLRAGGVKSGMWDLWVRMHNAGMRLKCVPEITIARSSPYVDTSPPPTPPSSGMGATFYYQATPGTAYWRCLLPAPYLPGVAIGHSPRMDENSHAPTNHRGATAVFQFAGSAYHWKLINRFKQLGIRTLVEADDDYAHRNEHQKGAGWGKTIDQAQYSVEGFVKCLNAADGVTCTTEFLAKQYRPHNENVYVCPNQIDPADWPALEKPDDGKFRIGWFASASHRPDLPLVARAMEWASRQPDVEVLVTNSVGVLSGGKPLLKHPHGIVPWTNDMNAYRNMLALCDVGLAPIIGTPWANCRSDLKALEYGMVGAVPVLSEVPPYEGWADGDLCLKAKDAKGFLRAIQRLVQNRDEARQMGAALRERVLATRTVEQNISTWKQATQGVVA